MKKAVFGIAAAALGLVLSSCWSVPPPSRETALREMYAYSMALAPDSTTLATFSSAATGDTATWHMMYRSWKAMRAAFSATLGQLGYGTGPFTWRYGSREQTALSHFQRDLGIPVTGQLDSITVSNLVRAERALKISDIKLPMLSVSKSGGFVLAKGTWKAITNKLAYPANAVNIQCDATRGECHVVTATLISDALDQVALEETDLAIVHWSEDLVVAESGSHENGVTLTINIPASEVVWTQRNSGWHAPASGLTFKPELMSLRLVSGMELSPPFDGGELKEEHEALFGDKKRYLGLLRRNTEFEDER